MSVSDPLLKNFKNYLYSLRTTVGAINDTHEALQPFCQILELILRKGIKQSTSMFELSRRRDYWHWIDQLSLCNNNEFKHMRKPPMLGIIADRVNKSAKVMTPQGRGRYFIREALQSKVLVSIIELLADHISMMKAFYDPQKSILADEILFEIFKSQLLQTVEINFDLCLANHSFLDETWKLSVYKELEMVPCTDIGLRLLHVRGRVLVADVGKGSVAESTSAIEIGDVLDDLYDRALRNIVRGTVARKSVKSEGSLLICPLSGNSKFFKIPKLLKQHCGKPVSVSVVKSHDADGCIYPPIGELLKSAGLTVATLASSPETNYQAHSKKPPPHALLPDQIEDELPVHGANDRADYIVQFIGKSAVGQTGGVDLIEPAIHQLVNDASKPAPKRVVMELTETNIIIKNYGSDEVLMSVSYTEVSSCGRREDYIEYFAFIAGETTCTLAKDFVAYVFKALSAEESNIIICAIAQGFSRTHWFV